MVGAAKRILELGQTWGNGFRRLVVRSLPKRLQRGVPASMDYQAWRHRFLQDRLGLCLWLALVILGTFIARDLYSLYFPLRELERIPSEIRALWFPTNIALTVLLVTCLAAYQTPAGRRYPESIFLGISWSVTIMPQVLATLRGFPLPSVLIWSLVFLIQATLIPVRWRLHLISQLGLILYFYGVNSLLGFTIVPTVAGQPERSIYDFTVFLYLFWFCFICDLAVYLYERLQRTEFESQRQVQLFLHAVSHDLRNPVTGVALVLKNLLKKGGDSVTVSRSVLERMIDSSDRQLNLINSLLEVHSSELRGIALQPEPIALHTLVASAIADLEPLLEQNQTTVVNRVSPSLPPVLIDRTQIWRVFSNLIANALHHNPPGITLILDAAVEEDRVRCTVQDNGVGMTAAEYGRIFDLYSRGGQAARAVGLGLGLYICRQIILAHGGTIGVQSQPNEGATFWFTLPIAPSEDRPLSG